MTFPNTLFLITASVFSLFAIGLECGASLIKYNTVIEQTNREPSFSEVEVAPLETVGVIRRISKSEAAISEIHKDASLSVKRGASSMAVGVIEEGLKAAIELIAASSHITDKALASALEKSWDNPESAIKEIQEGIKTSQQIIYTAGFSLYYSFDAAGVISGDGSKPKKWIQLGLEFVQHGGTYAIACLGTAETLSTNGLKSNSAGAAKGLDAAQEAAITGYEAAIASLVLAGRTAFRGLSDDDDTGSNKNDNQICRIQTTTQSSEATDAASAIKYNAKQAIESISQGPVANVIYKIEKGLKCGIEAAAAGEASALRAISIATDLALMEPDIAVATFKAGIKALKMAIITAGNETCQGLDGAAIILGNQKIDKLVFAVLKVQNGITSALGDIETAEKLASIGLKIGGDVVKQGLKAAYKSVLAVLFVFYSLLVTIGEGAF